MNPPEKSAEILTPFGKYRTPQASKEIIDLMEEMLERAKRGEVTALALVALAPNDHSITAWRQGQHSMFTVVGLIDILKDDVLDQGRIK
jgi:hypothetical protein